MKKFVIVCVLGCLVGLGMYFSQTVSVVSETVDTRPIATVTLSTGGTFKILLHPEEAPNTVNNFLYLAGIGFYDDTLINRIVPNYLIQAGDPIGNGRGFPGYFIESECRYNGVGNTLRHKIGTVSMARSSYFNTEGSQFFIMLDDDGYLNGQYSAFGTIIEGMESLQALSDMALDESYVSNDEIKIETIEINTFGLNYEKPEVLSVQEVLALYE